MKIEKLSDIKKELQHLPNAELAEICLKLARYKKENKELLGYLLFDADDEMAFAESYKAEMRELFGQLPAHQSLAIKQLRKILRLATKYIRFTGSKAVETEILMAFCKNFLEFIPMRSASRSLTVIYLKQLDKIKKAIAKLHEDLQFDYGREFDLLLDNSVAKIPYFNKKEYTL